MQEIVYLDGKFVNYDQALVSVEDRGFQFGDGIYEMYRYYNGVPLALDDHLERLERGAAALEIDLPVSREEIKEISLALLSKNNLEDAMVYLQVTRGAAPRIHFFPENPRPTVVAMARAARPHDRQRLVEGVAAITIPDTRWSMCYIKTTNLLPNALGKEKARRSGAYEAIFIRDGFLTEATSSNVLVVMGGTVYTPPLTNYILPGITRAVALELCAQQGVAATERAISEQELRAASEIMVTGTGTEILAVTSLDGEPVGAGRPGEIYATLRAAFERRTSG